MRSDSRRRLQKLSPSSFPSPHHHGNTRRTGCCRQRRESTHTTSPKPNTAQKPWNKTMVEAESYEASPPNDQTRTMKIELLIQTSNKNYNCSTSVGSDSLGRWFYN